MIPLAPLYAALVAGASLVVAYINAVLRDVEHILAAALLPWFFLTPILWSFATLDPSQQAHHKLIEVLRWGNPIAPPIAALRDALWSGHAPTAGDTIYSPWRRSSPSFWARSSSTGSTTGSRSNCDTPLKSRKRSA